MQSHLFLPIILLSFFSNPSLSAYHFCYENPADRSNIYPELVSSDCYLAGHHLMASAVPRASGQPYSDDEASRGRNFHRYNEPLSRDSQVAIMNNPSPRELFGVPYAWSYGSCTIAIDLASRTDSRRAGMIEPESFHNIGVMALRIIQECVDGGPHVGGGGSLGQRAGIIIAVAGIPPEMRRAEFVGERMQTQVSD